MHKQIIIHTDGGSRGNPGLGGAGFTLEDEKGDQLLARGIYLGQTTNNAAEYTAVKEALTAAQSLGADSIRLFSDSELLVKQLNGQYKVKSENLRPFYEECMNLLFSFASWQVIYIPREKNARADALANEAMDKKKDVQYGIRAGSVSDPTVKARGRKSPDYHVAGAPCSECHSRAGASPALSRKLRLAILLSGGGRTMVNLQEEIDAGRLNAEIVRVISSRSDVQGNDRARKIGIEPVIIRKKDYPDIADFSRRIAEELDEAKVDLVVQAGWLCLWHIPAKYENRVMNIHPALLPSFGGQGLWGHHVHEAVLKAGCKVSGCTVHFCTNEYDAGPIIVQRVCEVKDDDDADTLAARVFEQECIAYPQAIQLFAENGLTITNGLVKRRPSGERK